MFVIKLGQWFGALHQKIWLPKNKSMDVNSDNYAKNKMLMRAAKVVQIAGLVLSFIACYILLVIAPLAARNGNPMWCYVCTAQCSQSCGLGVQYRTVSCVQRSSNRSVAASRCANSKRPHRQRTCNLGTCPTMWITGDWTQVCITPYFMVLK